MTWKGKGLTDIGRVRQTNQDAIGIYDHLRLWIVADGMGGHAGGEVASQLAVEALASYVGKQDSSLSKDASGSTKYPLLLQAAMEAANLAIREHARRHIELTGMGTTAVAVHISISIHSPFLATVAHAGDSRAYLLRNQTLAPLTRDHSLVEERIQLGILTEEQALTHPLRHVLTRALGIEHAVIPSVTTIPLTESDKLLLCSDGLTKMMTDQHILNTILRANHSLESTCHALIEEANNQGGQDNVTVVMVGAE